MLDFCNEEDYYCTKTAKCQCCRDDMEEIYHHLETSDLVVLGSPIYYGNVSSRLKSIL
jgi:multimeric flavodoxin WrbA